MCTLSHIQSPTGETIPAYAHGKALVSAISHQPPDALSPDERETEMPYCFDYGQTYRRNEKNEAVWYSHKISHPVAGGPEWCRY